MQQQAHQLVEAHGIVLTGDPTEMGGENAPGGALLQEARRLILYTLSQLQVSRSGLTRHTVQASARMQISAF